MTKTMGKHILRDIRSTLNRFAAIFVISALGTGVFAGLRATGPDMRMTADYYYQEQNLADFRLLSTYGFTDEDIDALSSMDEVDEVMATYGIDLLVESEGGTAAMRIHALPQDTSGENQGYLNQIVLKEGTMPEAPGEALADINGDYAVGDIIYIDNGNDEDLLELMEVKEFTVTGIAESPYYISYSRGYTTIGDGSLDNYLYVTQEAFKRDYYLEVFLKLTDTQGLSAFDQMYNTYTEKSEDSIEALGQERSEVRYAEIQEEYQAEIDDGWVQYLDEKTRVEQELEDAWRQLSDAAQEISHGEGKIADGKTEIADAQLALLEAQEKIADGQRQLDSSIAELNRGEEEYAQSRSRYNEGMALYQSGLEQYEAGLARYQEALSQYNTLRAEYEAAAANLEALAAAAGQLQASGGQLGALLDTAEAAESQEEYQAVMDIFLVGAADALGALRQLAYQMEAASQSDGAAELYNAANVMEQYIANGLYRDAVSILSVSAAGVNEKIGIAQSELEESLPALLEAEGQLSESWAVLDSAKSDLDASLKELERAEAQLAAARRQLDDGWTQTETAKATLSDAKQELEEGERELAAAKSELAEGERNLAEGKREYQEGLSEYLEASERAEKEFADARQELNDAQTQLDDLQMPQWYVYDRDNFPSYPEFSSNADRITAISSVIPYFFFLVAALVCLTTMTRMVEEQRTNIGAFKALGFGKGAIAAKFLIYAGAASIAGGIFGALLGRSLFPAIIWNAYRIMYYMPDIIHSNQLPLIIKSVAAMTLVTILATVSTCFSVLRSVPAELMRPKAPGKGTRVWLEHFGFIWSRLKFSHKVTVRNMFRYKKRFFMTVVGVAGCTALLVTGFGLKDSINGLISKQYDEIEHYSFTLYLENGSWGSEKTALNEALDEDGDYIYFEQFAVEVKSDTGDSSSYTTYLFAPEVSQIGDFITLTDIKTGDIAEYPQDGYVLLTQKIANKLNVREGDTVSVNRPGEKPADVTVAAIVENYVYHYVYLSPETYKAITGETPSYSRVMVKLEEDNESIEKTMEQLITDENVSGAVSTKAIRDMLNDQMESLNSVVWLIICCAALLASVVLYNLTNINIIERAREIATLKVLGFYQGEVQAYVYREGLAITCIGIAAGLILGVFLHRYIIITAEVDQVMFQRVIGPLSYIYSIAFTLVCALLVNMTMSPKLRQIDMVESLKSAE